MKRTIQFTFDYPHPIQKVRAAIATREAMETWLMPNDFEPRVGHRFTFRTDPAPGFDGIVHCEVEAIEPPRRLEYLWKGGPDSANGRFNLDTIVRFSLESIGGGTRLHLEHDGFTSFKSRMIGAILGSGWKRMIRTTLPAVLERLDGSGVLGPATSASEAIRCQKWGAAKVVAPLIALFPSKRAV